MSCIFERLLSEPLMGLVDSDDDTATMSVLAIGIVVVLPGGVLDLQVVTPTLAICRMGTLRCQTTGSVVSEYGAPH